MLSKRFGVYTIVSRIWMIEATAEALYIINSVKLLQSDKVHVV